MAADQTNGKTAIKEQITASPEKALQEPAWHCLRLSLSLVN